MSCSKETDESSEEIGQCPDCGRTFREDEVESRSLILQPSKHRHKVECSEHGKISVKKLEAVDGVEGDESEPSPDGNENDETVAEGEESTETSAESGLSPDGDETSAEGGESGVNGSAAPEEESEGEDGGKPSETAVVSDSEISELPERLEMLREDDIVARIGDELPSARLAIRDDGETLVVVAPSGEIEEFRNRILDEEGRFEWKAFDVADSDLADAQAFSEFVNDCGGRLQEIAPLVEERVPLESAGSETVPLPAESSGENGNSNSDNESE